MAAWQKSSEYFFCLFAPKSFNHWQMARRSRKVLLYLILTLTDFFAFAPIAPKQEKPGLNLKSDRPCPPKHKKPGFWVSFATIPRFGKRNPVSETFKLI
jgi:hypothetical protein